MNPISLLSILFLVITFSSTFDRDGDSYSSSNVTPGNENKINDSILNRVKHVDYDVLSYDISLTILPDNQKIEAITGIEFSAVIPIENYLLFDFGGLQVDSVQLDMEQVEAFVKDDLLTIELPQPLIVADTHLVQIFYQGTPQKGLYFRDNNQGNTIIYTHNEPYDAHFWFPCKDDPSDKAVLDMKITIPNQFNLVSNGKLIAQSNSGPLYTLHYWKENYPIATYLISFAAGTYTTVSDFYRLNNIDVPLSYYVYPSDIERGQNALAITKEMLDFYSSMIGDYPFLEDKYAMVEVPFREASAMENQTATTMRDVIMDNKNIIAHELAHQWWGDALTPASFTDIWLNEGFATYFDALFTEYKFGYDEFLVRLDEFHSQMNSDGSLAFPIYDPPQEYLFGNAVYMKGAWVLHMLRMEVGDSLFKKIYQHYFDKYKYLNVTTSQFQEAVETTTNRNFSLFFEQWLNYGGRPLIIGEWGQNKNGVNITLKQVQHAPVYQFDLELLIKGVTTDTLIEISLTDESISVQIIFNDQVRQIIIDPNRKILNSSNSPIYYIPDLTNLVNLYPNPFNQEVSISYQLGRKQNIKIDIYNILGEKVASLVDERKNIGVYSVKWSGKAFASGIYLCVLTFENGKDIKKMMLIK